MPYDCEAAPHKQQRARGSLSHGRIIKKIEISKNIFFPTPASRQMVPQLDIKLQKENRRNGKNAQTFAQRRKGKKKPTYHLEISRVKARLQLAHALGRPRTTHSAENPSEQETRTFLVHLRGAPDFSETATRSLKASPTRR